MHYWCVFEVVIVWLIGLSKPQLCSCRCRTLPVHWLFGSFLLFVAGALSPSSFKPKHRCKEKLYQNKTPSNLRFLLLVWPDARDEGYCCLCRCTRALSPLKPELKRLTWMTYAPRKLTVKTRKIIPPAHQDQMVSKGEAQGRHLDPGAGVDLLTNTIDGARTATVNFLASWTDKDCHEACAITFKFGPHQRCPLWKKVWSPTCPLNGSFLSPNCPLKGFFRSPNGIF